jgi:hypothetical protein
LLLSVAPVFGASELRCAGLSRMKLCHLARTD